jgi:hypothetical protein
LVAAEGRARLAQILEHLKFRISDLRLRRLARQINYGSIPWLFKESAMPRSPKKSPKKMPAIQEEKAVWSVRLDLSERDHERMKVCAGALGLSKASYARMAVLERMKADEGKSPKTKK